jgi:integrase
MSKINQYIQAATRDNTRQSYQAAVRHFEIEWGGFLPATADSIANYLIEYAETLAINTLRQRLAALAQWHISQGFPDPTKSPVVRKVFRGVQALHPAKEKQAKPLQLDQLEQVDRWLALAIERARNEGNRCKELRYIRNKALLLLGFWRGFRGDELTRLQVEDVTISPGEGMICYLSQTKSDRRYQGTSFKTPALSKLCPVEAFLDWIHTAQLTSGPAFRAIDRWGHTSTKGLHEDSLISIFRSALQNAGIESADLYSGHSLRRGFATWATANGWDLKTLMEYVGWKNVQSAMRYVDVADQFSRLRIEASLLSSKLDLTNKSSRETMPVNALKDK